ncbi:hypothetical protein WJX73_003299 [Symbiochloris irregularis]|uniref:Uncharacterized protein n=1 Tax=Symbiochloris irregularis TaxID=706552 RepID=A0AAW1PR51_9CHLO
MPTYSRRLALRAFPLLRSLSDHHQQNFGLFRSTHLGLQVACFATASSQEAVPLSVASYLIWGANTDVGKTVVSGGLVSAALQAGDRVGYIKPVQTGFPTDSDARTLARIAGGSLTFGPHAGQLAKEEPLVQQTPAAERLHLSTLFAWQQPVSPHLAAATEGRQASDAEVRSATLQELNAFAVASSQSRALALIETAGGPASPMPSGSLQCEAWRLTRIPGVLIGDGRLGGISATISAYESLQMRGLPPVAVALMAHQHEGTDSSDNAAALMRHFGAGVPVVALPYCAPPAASAGSGTVDDELATWLQKAHGPLTELLDLLHAAHQQRVGRLSSLAQGTLQHIWWPFTQHQGMTEDSVTVIESRAGESFVVLEGQEGTQQAQAARLGSAPQGARLVHKHDACSSWWTQGVSAQLQPRLVRKMAEAAGTYGHVMHPETAHEPALGLAERLLSCVGQGWADRVFYSDDGSTAVEVGLKMAMRKFRAAKGDVEGSRLEVVGLQNGYHGDTLGAMDAVAPSAFNGLEHMPWYKGRGLFLDPPCAGLVQGEFQIMLPEAMAFRGSAVHRPGWLTWQEVFDPDRDGTELVQHYTQCIRAEMARHLEERSTAGTPARLAVCLLEPVLQGAGGMHLIDPAFQRAMVTVCREAGMPILLDEVFSGLWRLGAPSAASLLHVQPDIACYAKLLTGGMLPLSATLASAAVFDAFSGATKLEALLHGHSYAGNAIGCALACEALDIFSDPAANPNLVCKGDASQQSAPGSCLRKEGSAGCCQAGCSLVDLWDEDLVRQLSHNPRVSRVVALGCVLAAELAASDGGGYASGEAKSVNAAVANTAHDYEETA